jgi:branched-chain amino acid transport system substrate-binding protein
MRFRQFLPAAFLWLTAVSALAQTGVTDSTIVLGQSAPLTGDAEDTGQQLRDGALAYFDYINSRGGVHGRKITLKTLDDAARAERAAANTRKLIDEEKVFALFGYVGIGSAAAALPLATQANMPLFAPSSGAHALRQPVNKNVFHIRASYADEAEEIVQHVTTLGMKRIAVFYQDNEYGKAALEGIQQALKKRGLEPVAVAAAKDAASDVTAAVYKLHPANPQTVILAAPWASAVPFIQVMRASGSVASYWGLSLLGSRALATEMGKEAAGVQISQILPAPWDERNAVIEEYNKLYLKNGKKEWSYTSLEGFIAAKVFAEGLQRAGRGLNRASLVKALESLAPYDVGGMIVRFSPDKRDGSSYVDLTMISRTGKFLH